MNEWVYFDVDSTLVMYDVVKEGKADPSELVAFKNPYYKGPSPYAYTNSLEYQEFLYLVPHYRHIEDLKQHHANGDTVVVHSAGGYEWARVVVDTLGLTQFVDYCLTKPTILYDDLPPKEWLPHGVRYREFKSKVKGKDEC
jgi:phosphoserine phosphatase